MRSKPVTDREGNCSMTGAGTLLMDLVNRIYPSPLPSPQRNSTFDLQLDEKSKQQKLMLTGHFWQQNWERDEVKAKRREKEDRAVKRKLSLEERETEPIRERQYSNEQL
ncbi:hypothetical protein BDZ91DRAFT_766705 [Kalaharituber pfeilii]|nr:hypothetical protein BDZ91DRAFT_766705 [Kalaharituber pfeilii]